MREVQYKERKDEIWKEVKEATEVSVHKNCRKEYTNPRRIKAEVKRTKEDAALQEMQMKEKLRSSEPYFDLKVSQQLKLCLIFQFFNFF